MTNHNTVLKEYTQTINYNSFITPSQSLSSRPINDNVYGSKIFTTQFTLPNHPSVIGQLLQGFTALLRTSHYYLSFCFGKIWTYI